MGSTSKEVIAKEKICLALDMEDRDKILGIVDELKGLVGYFKLNSAFALHGPGLVRDIKAKGCKVFLDLKFHDIPNTVSSYSAAAAAIGIDIFNVHALGGKDMMVAALNSAEACRGRTRPRIIAVTVLTSHDKKSMNALGIPGEVDDEVLLLAKSAAEAGLDGIVCSAQDLERIKPHLPKSFCFITPGIRPVGADKGDQKRVMTPANAIRAGSSLLVIGRAILDAKDRKKAALEILNDVVSAL